MTRQELEALFKENGYLDNVPRFPLAADMFDWHNRKSPEDELLLWYEYLVVVNPSGSLDRDVRRMKKQFAEMAPQNKSQYSQPHFTIAKLLLPNSVQYKLLAAIANAAMYTSIKRIHVHGFGKFLNKKGVIYLKPVEAMFFTDVQALLMTSMRKEGLNVYRNDFPPNPHLTILKDLNAAELERCLAAANDINYYNNFIADSLIVIKKPYGGTTPFYHVRTEELKGLAGTAEGLPKTRQQVLF